MSKTDKQLAMLVSTLTASFTLFIAVTLYLDKEIFSLPMFKVLAVGAVVVSCTCIFHAWQDLKSVKLDAFDWFIGAYGFSFIWLLTMLWPNK